MRILNRDIVGVYILSGDGCLLLGHNEKGGVYQGTWIVPGGGIEAGETKEAAARREVLEEIGIDLSEGYTLKALDLAMSGESQKLLPETGETVLAKMVFYVFTAKTDKPARDIIIQCSDDLAEVKWFPISDLSQIQVSPPTKTVLKHLGFIQKATA